MRIAITILILAVFQEIARQWGLYFKSIDSLNLLTNMMSMAAFDILTIFALFFCSVRFLTPLLQIVLILSIISHIFGSFIWVSYNPLLEVYDQSKFVILFLEIMAFLIYGDYKGGKRLRFLYGRDGDGGRSLGLSSGINEHLTNKMRMGLQNTALELNARHTGR